MAKFNRPSTPEEHVRRHPAATWNYEGGLAFTVEAETELYMRACTALFEDRYYTTAEQQRSQLRAAVHRCDRRYVLQLANYVRNAMHLRALPIALLAEASVMQSAARQSKADVRAYVPKIVRRADEPMELVAYWLANVGIGTKAMFPNALRKGLSDALLQFSEHQLAKYNRPGAVTLKDVLNIVHPRPDSPARSALYRRILDGELAQPDTWEVRISTQGSTAENWDAAAPTMGTMALLRNLRNFERRGARRALAIAAARFRDPEAVRNSKQLPFRWYQAYSRVHDPDVRAATVEALNLSLACVQPWTGTTAIICDNSASMMQQLSHRGKTRYIQVAALLGAMAATLSPDGYHVGVFGDEFAWVPSINPADNILANMRRIYRQRVGNATYAWLALQAMRQERVRVDRIVLLSDLQCYTSDMRFRGDESLAAEWHKYRRQVNPAAYLYSVDLAGYGTSQFIPADRQTVLLAGWHESVFEFVRHHENGSSALDEIKANW